MKHNTNEFYRQTFYPLQEVSLKGLKLLTLEQIHAVEQARVNQ